MRDAFARPTMEELRVVAQPPQILGRVSGEHWAGARYMRRASIHLTRTVIPFRAVTPDRLTWSMLLVGAGAAAVLTVPTWWAALIAVVLVQMQLLLDCSDGELARWRGTNSALGIYVDRLGHYVTDAGLVAAVGVHADGGLGSVAGWSTVGLAAAVLVLLTKAETDLVHVARAATGLDRAADDVATAAPRHAGIRRLRTAVRRVPFNRALLAVEMSLLALVASIVDAATSSLAATRVLSVALMTIAVLVVFAHLLSVVASGRLR